MKQDERRKRCITGYGKYIKYILTLLVILWSGRYLEAGGSGWFLKEADGTPVSGVQYVIPSKKGKTIFEKGYYFFGKTGRLSQKQGFRKISQPAGAGSRVKIPFDLQGQHDCLCARHR